MGHSREACTTSTLAAEVVPDEVDAVDEVEGPRQGRPRAVAPDAECLRPSTRLRVTAHEQSGISLAGEACTPSMLAAAHHPPRRWLLANARSSAPPVRCICSVAVLTLYGCRCAANAVAADASQREVPRKSGVGDCGKGPHPLGGAAGRSTKIRGKTQDLRGVTWSYGGTTQTLHSSPRSPCEPDGDAVKQRAREVLK